MTITKVIKDLIEPNTYNEITSNIGNTQPVTINSIQFANVTFSNTTNTSILTTGGYFKLYGNNYQANANVYLDRYIASNTRYISNNELRVTFSTLPPGTYSLFLYNPNGSNAIKYKSIVVQGNNTMGYIVAGTAGKPSPSPGLTFGTNYSSVERILFSNDTVTADTRGNITETRALASSVSNNLAGYTFGGRANSSIASSSVGSVAKISFNNDTAVATSFASPTNAHMSASVQNASYGYLASGFDFIGPQLITTIFRFTFSSDTTAQSARASIDTGRTYMMSADNNNYGWFFGGSTQAMFASINPGSTVRSQTSRLDFSADTNLTIVRGPIGKTVAAASSVQNQTYAWVAGGVETHSYNILAPAPTFTTSSSTGLSRFDFANDTTTGINRSPTTGAAAQSWTSSVHDLDYGWFAGGAPIPTSPVTTNPAPSTNTGYLNNFFDNTGFDSPTPLAQPLSFVSRLTFSNDTVATNIRGPLNQIRRNATGINGINT